MKSKALFRLTVGTMIRCLIVSVLTRECLAGASDYSESLSWGNSTNGVKAGLSLVTDFYYPRGSFFPYLKVETNNTNGLWIWLPATESLFYMSLRDEMGNLVPKTSKGQKLGQPLRNPLRTTTGVNRQAGYSWCIVTRDGCPLTNKAFTPQDFFAITNSGRYRLKVQMDVIWFPNGWKGILTRDIPPTMRLPPVEVEFQAIRRDVHDFTITPAPKSEGTR